MAHTLPILEFKHERWVWPPYMKGKMQGLPGSGLDTVWQLEQEDSAQVQVIIMGTDPITRSPLFKAFFSAEAEVVNVGACSITRFPLLKAFFSTHIES